MSGVHPVLERLLREVMPRGLHKLPLQTSMTLAGNLAIESIGLISLAFRIEEEFGVDLMAHTEEVAGIRTIGQLQELVQKLEGPRP